MLKQCLWLEGRVASPFTFPPSPFPHSQPPPIIFYRINRDINRLMNRHRRGPHNFFEPCHKIRTMPLANRPHRATPRRLSDSAISHYMFKEPKGFMATFPYVHKNDNTSVSMHIIIQTSSFMIQPNFACNRSYTHISLHYS